MPADSARKPGGTARRRFLGAAAAAGAAAIAAPRVARAQAVHWRVQSAWSSRDIFHEFAQGYATAVGTMSGGRLKIEMLSGGAVVPPFQMAEAVHSGILDGAHGTAALRHNKHKANSLFGTPPSFGWDSHSFLGWFYYGGGEALYKELLNGILRLNVVGWLHFPMPNQPLGWFKKEITRVQDFRGLRYRTGGLVGELFQSLGAQVTLLPGGDVAAAIDRGVLDATDSNNPTADILLGLPGVAKVYVLGGHHQPVEAFEVLFNKSKYDALPGELREILRQASFAASSDNLWRAYDRYARDFQEIGRRGVKVFRAGPQFLDDQLKAWDRVLAALSKEAFFAKVVASQKAWVRRTGAYFQAASLDSEALSRAYKHHFG
ncbi:MAG: TRAP transporter substrate-binding protein [Alphaproteobacteria bacterium]|nr:TRAP transporter substrate-binding protein [Alphaproteobacteria bacterium]